MTRTFENVVNSLFSRFDSENCLSSDECAKKKLGESERVVIIFDAFFDAPFWKLTVRQRLNRLSTYPSSQSSHDHIQLLLLLHPHPSSLLLSWYPCIIPRFLLQLQRNTTQQILDTFYLSVCIFNEQGMCEFNEKREGRKTWGL